MIPWVKLNIVPTATNTPEPDEEVVVSSSVVVLSEVVVEDELSL